MKKKMIWVSAIVESLIVGLVTYNFISKGYSIRNLLGFPFSNIILGLGKLSASGKVGNGFAVMLWLLISSIPALVAIFFPKGKLSSIVRLLLFALSFITLDRLLALANLYSGFSGTYINEKIMGFEITFLSICVLIATFILIDKLEKSNKSEISSIINILKLLLYIIFYGIIAYVVYNLVVFLNEEESIIFPSIPNYLIYFSLYNIKHIFNLVIIVQILEMLNILKKRDYEKLLISAKMLNSLCFTTLVIIVLSMVFTNIFVIIFARDLYAYAFNPPIFNIVIVLVILLFTKLLLENEKLKNENDSFI